MKKETEDLIFWIKNSLRHYVNRLEVHEGELGLKEYREAKEKLNKANNFLDSLEAFERQLKFGGYIPDCNNTPCKHGDKVKWLGTEYKSDIDSKNDKIHDKVYILEYENNSWGISTESGWFVEVVSDRSEILKINESEVRTEL